MRIDIDDYNYIVIDGAGGVHVTRQTVLGGVATHKIASGSQTPLAIGSWLWGRLYYRDVPMIHDAFPDMNKEDREFLLSGVTPERWGTMFPSEEK